MHIDEHFLHVQNIVLNEFLRVLPENEREAFLFFYLNEISSHFRKIHSYIEDQGGNGI